MSTKIQKNPGNNLKSRIKARALTQLVENSMKKCLGFPYQLFISYIHFPVKRKRDRIIHYHTQIYVFDPRNRSRRVIVGWI